MMVLSVAVAGAVFAIAFSDWRRGVLLAVCTGFAQDVIRKLTPGEPVYLVLLFGVVFGVAAIALYLRGGDLTLAPLMRLHPRTRAPILVFVGIVLVQVLVTLITQGSVLLAGIGAMAYLLPLVALGVALYYAGTTLAVRRLLIVYVAMSAVFCAGVYLNVLGYQSGILDSVGEGNFIYPREGGVVKLPSGLFRSPEIAAWHGATAVVLTGLMVSARLMPGGALAGGLLIAFLLGAVVLTGRRKMIVELVVFVPVFLCLLAWLQGRAARVTGLLLMIAGIVYLTQLALIPNDSERDFQRYVSRYDTVADEATERLTQMTVHSVRAAIETHGFFGAGAGIASQGAQHFSGGVRLAGYTAEGGIAKLLSELGVPGLAAALWAVLALVIACLRSVQRAMATGQRQRAVLTTGLLSLLIVNVLVFATASQVFGDPFVLLVIGMLIGVILRVPLEPAGEPRAAAGR